MDTSNSKKYKLLIVEDEDAIRQRYVEYFQDEGFEVKYAANGQDALELLESFDYDVLLLDIRLPKIDGLEVLKNVKSNPSTSHKKVFLLTALGRDSIIKEGFDLGADGYLIKDQETPDTIKKNIMKALEG